jgi:hypothetical protein
MTLGQELSWPLTNGINEVSRWSDIHAASACTGGVSGWA